jgi:hypothetical protein
MKLHWEGAEMERTDGSGRRQRGRPVASQLRGEPAVPPETAAGSGLTRVTVNLNRQAMQALEWVGDATGYSKTDTINRALQVYAIVQKLMQRNGGVLQVTQDNGAVERIHIV